MSAEEITDYDQIAEVYDLRYHSSGHRGILSALRAVLSERSPKHVLEVGCGTCHWLKGLQTVNQCSLWGIDRSHKMLTQTSPEYHLLLSQGIAENPPFNESFFDVVYCVNAIHHFFSPEIFIDQTFRILQPDGDLIIIGTDPHDPRNQWYIYEYFENVFERDLERFPAWQVIEDWLHKAGFTGVNQSDVEMIDTLKTTESVLQDPFLQKNGCSQMMLLNQEDYQQGLNNIISAINSDCDKSLTFANKIVFSMLTAKKPT